MAERIISYAEALVEALHEGMTKDRTVTMIGSYVLGLGPQRHFMERIRNDFPDRLFDPPTAEAGAAAVGVGAAMAGIRPFVDLGTATFSYLAWSQLVNEAPVAHFMTGGKAKCPVTYHMLHGIRGQGGAQHSGSPQAMLWNAPGLQIVLPSTANDVKGLIRTCLANDNPTVVLSHAKLLGIAGPVTDEPIPFGKADIKRRGKDVTIVAYSLMVHEALKAAEILAKEGIDAEVLDPRTQRPLDEEAILESVGRTGRLVVVDECPPRASVASEIAATVAERGFDLLKAPIRRVTRLDAPNGYATELEAFIAPDAAKVAQAVREIVR